MNHLILLKITLLFVFVLTACSQYHDPIEIKDAWIREAPPNATAMAGYMQIVNNTENDIELVAAQSPNFKIVEFHRSVEKDGVYRMVRHKQLTIPAKGQLELKPGDFHLMLITPHQALRDGDQAEVTLTMADNTSMTHSIPVKKPTFE